MKTILTTILAVTVGVTSVFAEPAKSDFFSFSAKSAQRGKSGKNYKDNSGHTVQETTRSQAVDATIFFTRGPSVEYAVQCFFIAQDEGSKEKYIYDAQTQPVAGSKGDFFFRAPILTGTVRRSIRLPVSGMTTTGVPVSGMTATGVPVTGVLVTGSVSISKTTTGSKIYGWLIRLVANGKTVRIVTNQSPLKTLAEKNPDYFDAAFK